MKRYKNKLRGFTLIEILVVATIISLLAAGAFVSYSQLNKQSRDAKRKADLEQVRAALEQYRSNNSYYPTGSGAFSSALTTLTGSPTYISTLPTDPLGGTYSYQYTAKPNGCDNSATYCSSYTIGTILENSSSSCTTAPSGYCKTSPNTSCSYCTGPYGKN